MKHPAHRHPLFLSEENSDTDLPCDICSKPISNPYYVCVKCQFYLHKSCADLSQQINHPFHPQHALHLRSRANYACDSCHKRFKISPSYQCKTCDFDLDVECALMPAISPEGDDYIQHFSHQHPLTPYNKDDNPSSQCFVCKTNSSNPIYGCTTCEYFLHKSCAELPKTILHDLHPSDTLNLSVRYGHCDYCLNYNHSFKYKCEQHGFCLDAMCALMPTSKEQGEEHKKLCVLCNSHHSDEDYFCIPSNYYLNESCLMLPEDIEHHFHAHKPLKLSSSNRFWCDSCHNYFNDTPSFSCDEHNFHMDVRCGLMSPIESQGEDHIQHFSHQHPLILLSQLETPVDCFACSKSCASLIYACLQCGYFLHESCAQMSGEVAHPVHNHTDHSLTLQVNHGVYSCNCCQISSGGFIFRCDLCDLNIGIECLSLRPTIDYKYHQHQLCFVEGVNYSKLTCSSLHTSCKLLTSSNEMKLTEPYFFRCADCNFSLHLLCGTLPCTIKQKWHIHALTLKDSIVEDDSDEYYCDICKEERDPRICVYYCEDCGFIAHIHCVINEVISVLRDDTLEVEKRIVGDWRIDEELEKDSVVFESETDSDTDMSEDELKLKTSLTLMDILNSIMKDQRMIIEGFFQAKLFEENNGAGNDIGLSETKQEADNILALSPYNEDFVEEFESRIETCIEKRKYLIGSDEYHLEVVEMKGYLIPSYLAPVLRNLFIKYGKLKFRSSLGRKARSIVLYLVCWAINDMSRTYSYDVTEDQLSKWVHFISGAEQAGFNVDFAEDCFERVIESHLGLQAIKQEEEIPQKLDQRIEKLSQEITQLTAKVEELKESREQFIACVNGEKSDKLQHLMSKGHAYKWKTMRDYFLC